MGWLGGWGFFKRFRCDASPEEQPHPTPKDIPADVAEGQSKPEEEPSPVDSEAQDESNPGLLLSSSTDSDFDDEGPGELGLYVLSSSFGGSARSGFNGAGSWGQSSLTASGNGRLSTRRYLPPHRTNLAGGAGVLGVLREQSWEGEPTENTAQSVTGDIGIGAIPALELARREQQKQDGGNEGVEETKGQSQEQSQRDGANEEGLLQQQMKSLWLEEDDEPQEPPEYLINRDILYRSLGENESIMGQSIDQ